MSQEIKYSYSFPRSEYHSPMGGLFTPAQEAQMEVKSDLLSTDAPQHEPPKVREHNFSAPKYDSPFGNPFTAEQLAQMEGELLTDLPEYVHDAPHIVYICEKPGAEQIEHHATPRPLPIAA